MKKRLFLSGLTLVMFITITGCAKYDKPFREYHPNGYYCQKIMLQLHGGAHRHNAGRKLTAIGRARLMREYKDYRCNPYK